MSIILHIYRFADFLTVPPPLLFSLGKSIVRGTKISDYFDVSLAFITR